MVFFWKQGSSRSPVNIDEGSLGVKSQFRQKASSKRIFALRNYFIDKRYEADNHRQ